MVLKLVLNCIICFLGLCLWIVYIQNMLNSFSRAARAAHSLTSPYVQKLALTLQRDTSIFCFCWHHVHGKIFCFHEWAEPFRFFAQTPHNQRRLKWNAGKTIHRYAKGFVMAHASNNCDTRREVRKRLTIIRYPIFGWVKLIVIVMLWRLHGTSVLLAAW